MSATATARAGDMLWMDHQEDRGFRWLSIFLLVLFLTGGVVLNSIELPEVEQKRLVDVSPRLAKLILEKQKEPPPPPPAPKPKKEQAKKEKPAEKKKPPPKKAEKAPPKKSAREVAQQSGLIAMADELADLRDSFALDDLAALPQTSAGKQAIEVASTDQLLTAGAGRSSGGIQTDTLNRKITTSELAQRRTTSVESAIEAAAGKSVASSSSATRQKDLSTVRSRDEIERVFQQYKGGIFNIYNRALRKDPTLAGKVVIELTIAPDGSVKAARILSSELGDEQLERKLILKIKRFKFSKSNVAEITVTYPIEFLPS
ncbi:MAG TPA: AgmX/PglI C-terminal domain-containing protein [Gammaproteobacteria bacterium]|jgi:TonB family protein